RPGKDRCHARWSKKPWPGCSRAIRSRRWYAAISAKRRCRIFRPRPWPACAASPRRPKKEARKLSDELIAELRAADTIVIGAPMYNFGVTTGLRGWFDYVLRAGETFSYSSAGPKGLLEGKRVIVIESRGGLYSEGPAKVVDFQEPYLRHLLGFIGLTDVTFVRAEKIGYGPEARDASLTQAKLDIAALVHGGTPQEIAA